jgi:hypothetical protein
MQAGCLVRRLLSATSLAALIHCAILAQGAPSLFSVDCH